MALRWMLARWPGLGTGIMVSLIGIGLTITAYAVQTHAAYGTAVDPGLPYELPPGPVHVVGVVGTGDDAATPAACTVSSAGRSETFAVSVRRDRYESIPAGQRLPAGPGTLVCDRRVAVTTGPAVIAYPLARSSSLFLAYLMMAGLGVAFIAVTASARRLASPAVATRLRPFAAVSFLLALCGTVGVIAGYLLTSARDSPSLDAALDALLVFFVLPGAIGLAALLTRPWSAPV